MIKTSEKHKLLSLVMVIVIVVGTIFSVVNVSAANVSDESVVSADDVSDDEYHCCSYYLNTEDNGHRMVTEWFSWLSTAGIERKNKICVYLKAGETAYFGSTVHDSLLREDGYAYDADDNIIKYRDEDHPTENESAFQTRIKENAVVRTKCDILVETPNGEKIPYDVIWNGAGHIRTRAAELAGAKYPGHDVENAYKPLSIEAKQEGIYYFYFHSMYGSGVNPGVRTAATNPLYDFVSAWDVTVVDTHVPSDDGGSEIAVRKPGRVFAKYLAMNNGSNTIYSNIKLYVLTSDGIKYRVTMDKIDPFGFIFFANNRGLYKNNIDRTAVYYSVYTGDLPMNNLYPTTDGCGISIHSPMAVDTEYNKTFDLFFEDPNPDLKHILYEDPDMPTVSSDVSFIGNNGNHTKYAYGGYFRFTTKNASSLTLAMNVEDVIRNNAENATDPLLKQKSQEYIDSGGNFKIELNGPVIDGENEFYWNGKDTNGLFIPIGDYNINLYDYELTPKVGEVHFPLLDVEGMGKLENDEVIGGFSVERINDIVSSDGSSITCSDKDLLYYNNNPLAYGNLFGKNEDGTITRNKQGTWYVLGDGSKTNATFVDGSAYGNKFFRGGKKANEPYRPIASLDGTNNVMAFQKSGGDTSAIDTWTNCYVTGYKIQATADFVIEDDNKFTGNLKGRVFYDEEPDGTYIKTPKSTDFPLSRYVMAATCIQSYDEEVSVGDKFYCTTKADGVYVFQNLPKGIYTVDFSENDLSEYQINAYGCTTKNSEMLCDSTNSGVASISHTCPQYTISEDTCDESNGFCVIANEIGVHIDDAKYSYTIHKTWGVSVNYPLDSINVTLYAAEKDENGNLVTIGWVKKFDLTANMGWQYTINNLSQRYLYYVTEYYYDDDGNEVIVGGSDPAAPELNRTEEEFEEFGENITVEQSADSDYNVTFDYACRSESERYINMTNATSCYKVYFHYNLTSDNDNDIYRVYYPREEDFDYAEDENGNPLNDPVDKSVEAFDGRYWLTKDCRIMEFYSIPRKGNFDSSKNFDILNPKLSNTNGKIFLGWYYEPNYNAEEKPIKWNTDEYKATTHIYAHWLEVGTVDKDSKDSKMLTGTTYKGFDFVGTQIRNYIYDLNYDDRDTFYEYEKQIIGLRFITVIKNEILSRVNGVYSNYYDMDKHEYTDELYNVESGEYVTDVDKSQNLSYGYVSALSSSTRAFYDVYKNKTYYEELEYSSTNTNGVDTSKIFRYVKKSECTSDDYNHQTSIKDHRNYDDYRMMSLVITYEKGDTTANKAKEYVVRPYIKYVDGNGLVRIFYTDYDGNSVLMGGCSTSFNVVNELFNNLKNENGVVNPPEQATTQ